MKKLILIVFLFSAFSCKKENNVQPEQTQREKFNETVQGRTWWLVRYVTTLNGNEWFYHPYYNPGNFYIKFYKNNEFTYYYTESCLEGNDYGVSASGSYSLESPYWLVFNVAPNSNKCKWLEKVKVVTFSSNEFALVTEDDSLYYRSW